MSATVDQSHRRTQDFNKEGARSNSKAGRRLRSSLTGVGDARGNFRNPLLPSVVFIHFNGEKILNRSSSFGASVHLLIWFHYCNCYVLGEGPEASGPSPWLRSLTASLIGPKMEDNIQKWQFKLID